MITISDQFYQQRCVKVCGTDFRCSRRSSRRKSKIETHPKSNIIIRRLASGENFSNIVEDFPDIRYQDLDYFKENKLPALIAQSHALHAEIEQAHEQKESEQGNNALGEIQNLQAKAMEILAIGQDAGDLKTALLGIREARSCVELCLKAEGQLREQSINVNLQQTQLNVYDSPAWLAVGRP